MLQVRNLTAVLESASQSTPIIDRVTLTVEAGQTVALVGESGCGKSITALSILGLLPPGVRITSGSIRYRDRELTRLPPRELQRIRGGRMAVVFQEPMTALNPVLTVGEQVAEPLRVHRGLSRRQALRRAIELLEAAGVPAPDLRARAYPHELSGGLRQRAVIAMALACEPDLLIADEPTSALDVTTQAHVLAVLKDWQRRHGMGLLLITHDLALVAGTADRVYVMYSGRIVEHAAAYDLFARPLHPYTQALLRSVPDPDRPPRRDHPLPVIPGEVPRPMDRPSGCAFHPRCGAASDDAHCRQQQPALHAHRPGHEAACWHIPAPAGT